MAEISVNFLIEKLATLFNDDVNLLSGIRDNVAWLRAEMERLRPFLRIAEALQDSDVELRIWVTKVREISQETDHLLAEYTLLKGHNHDPGIYGSLCRASCCVKNAKACYRVVAELKRVKSGLKGIGDILTRLRGMLGRRLEPAGAPFDQSELVRIDQRRIQIVERLVRDGDGREVVSLIGLGGLGKTLLARQVYESEEAKKVFKARAWVNVSQSFEADDLLKDMVRELYRTMRRKVPAEIENLNFSRRKTVIEEILKKQRYLIVLDDVWSSHVWRSVQHVLPNNSLGSKVLLTTRNLKIASFASQESERNMYFVEPLTTPESWDILCRTAFQGAPCPLNLKEICTKILKKCEGLPLAIEAIGGVLAKKDRQRIEEWDFVARSLGAEIDGNENLKILKKALSLSFNDLPYYLKSCFLYLSVFPEDHLIERMRLIRLWIAEGFVKAKPGEILEDVAEEYLRELLARSLMQVAATSSDGRVKYLRIHNLLREIIVFKSRDQNIATILDQNMQCYARAWRLSVHYTLQHLLPSTPVSQLRSLFVFEVAEKLNLHRLFPEDFRLLSVLDLQNSNITRFPVQVVNLQYLKYLSLRNTKIEMVPRFIGKLRNLETLDLKNSKVTELPLEVLQLQRLRHLLVYRSEFASLRRFNPKSGFKIGENVGALQSLRNLCYIDASNQGSGNMLIEIGNLNQLYKLGILKLRSEDGKLLCKSIEKLTKLRTLSIASVLENEVIDLKHISNPLALLQRLYIRGRLEILPQWITSSQSIVKLDLKWSKLSYNPLASLGCMPNLVHLVLCQTFTEQKLCFRTDGFKKLKILVLDDFDELRCLEVECGAMKILEDLTIGRCELLEKVPSGIEYLTKLKFFELSDMPVELFDNLSPNVKDSEYWRVAHVPDVYSTYWRGGEWKVYSLQSLSDGENCPLPSTFIKTRQRWK